MMRPGAFVAAVVIAALVAAPSAASVKPGGGAFDVSVAPDCLKVKRGAGPVDPSYLWSASDNLITLSGARNEYIGFQLIIHANSKLSGVTASASDLTGPGGRITSRNFSFFREHYLRVTETSTSMYGDPPSDGTGWYPDPLVPFGAPDGGAPFPIEKGRNQGVWVDIYVPEGTVGGVYRGDVSVRASGAREVRIGISLEVWDFTLPEENHFKTWFYFGQDELANGHHVAKYDDDYKALERKYHRMAHEHRVNIDAPVYWEYSGTGDGVTIDWGYHDELSSPLNDGTYYDDGIGKNPICLPVGQDFPWPGDHGGLYSDEFARTFRKTLRLVKEHYDRRGWSDRAFLWIIDEPNDYDAYKRVRRYGELVDDSGTDLPLMVTESPVPDDYSWGSLAGYVDIWCAGGTAYPGPMNERRAAGERTWSYNGGRPYAGSQLIDTLGMGMRTWPWLGYKYGVECWLYWHCMYWKDIFNDPAADNDVWGDPLTFDQRRSGTSWPDWGNGDGTLFYPGYDRGIDGPVSSIRMKMLRRGLQDYEYMWLLGSQGNGSVARRAVDTVIKYGFGDAEGKPAGWSTDPGVWEAAREEMASHILPGDFEVESTWYLAEGTTRSGFEEWISIVNPGGEEARVRITYMLASGENRVQDIAVGPRTRHTVDVNLFLGPELDASAVVESDRDVVVERPMYFDYHGKWDGGHNVAGQSRAGTTWYLAEGTTRSGFEEWISIVNPGGEEARVRITYMLASGENRVQDIAVGPRTRHTVDVNLFLGPELDASAVVESDRDVVVERPMYFDYHGKWDGGHNVAGYR
jgi:hypothetical protein